MESIWLCCEQGHRLFTPLRRGIILSEGSSHGAVQLEDEHFHVTKWTIAPGGVIPMHRHDHKYVVIPLVTQSMHVTSADGSAMVADLAFGESYTRPAGSEHQVENRGPSEAVVFVEVERL